MNKQLLTTLFIIFLGTLVYSQTTMYYLGTGKPSDPQLTSCASCHSQNNIGNPIYEEWVQTRHAVAQDSMANPFYSYDCLECHNTGWDLTKDNYGADEYVVKDTTHSPNYVVTDSVNWNRVKNVGCEACHGPTGNQNRTLSQEHWFTTYKANYTAELCGSCHQDAHHPYFEEWQESAHSNANLTTPTIATNKRCVKCHVAQNFIAYANNPTTYRDTILVTGADVQPITCVACHDPHSNQFSGQLRFPISSASTICDKCHTAGIDTVNINTTPHHTTAEALSGTTNFGYRYPGSNYINSAHTYAVFDRCVACHVHTTPFAGGVAAVTGHTFEPRVEACQVCHTDYLATVDTSNHEKRFDYRGIQTEIEGLIAALKHKLQNSTHADSITDAFKKANYNYNAIMNEGSRGIHNTRLVRKLLQDAISNFNPTGIEEIGSEIPTEFAISQNYPNPFNPVTSISFSLPVAGNVRLTVYDALGKEIEVLANEFKSAGNYKVTWDASRYSSGIYFYRIENNKNVITKKMVLLK